MADSLWAFLLVSSEAPLLALLMVQVMYIIPSASGFPVVSFGQIFSRVPIVLLGDPLWSEFRRVPGLIPLHVVTYMWSLAALIHRLPSLGR